jgi:hypothetical protein
MIIYQGKNWKKYLKELQVTDYFAQPMKNFFFLLYLYRGADKSLARPGREQATATEDFEFHISYL